MQTNLFSFSSESSNKTKENVKVTEEKTKEQRESNIVFKLGDAFELIKSVEDNSIDLILTDPPYNDVTHLAYKNSLCYDKKLQLAREFKRVLKITGSVIIFCGFEDQFEWYNVLKQTGFIFKRQCVIVYENMSRKPNRNFIPQHESYLFFVKSDRYYWNNNLQNPTTVYKTIKVMTFNKRWLEYIGIPLEKIGVTPKPLKLIIQLVQLLTPCGGTVLDPFCGSGTTALACKLTNRNCICFEINKDIYEIAKRRLQMSNIEQFMY